jgi:hypothetical protein
MAVMGSIDTKEIALSKTLQEELKQLLQLPHVEVLGENLRRMFIDYLEYEMQIGVPTYFDEFLYPFNCLLDFLDVAAKERAVTECKKAAKKKKKKAL